MSSFTSKILGTALFAGVLALTPTAQAEPAYQGVNLHADLGNGLYIKVYDRHRPGRHHRPSRRPPPRGYWHGGRWYSGYWHGGRWYGAPRHDSHRYGHGGYGHRHGGYR